MSGIKQFIEHYQEIIDLIDEFHFDNPILFKGFSEKEEHNFNLVVEDRLTYETEIVPQTSRRMFLKENLQRFLKCKIVLMEKEQMDEHYSRQLNSSNSVTIKKETSTESIIAVFGEHWIFNPPEVLSDFWMSSRETRSAEKKLQLEHLATQTVKNVYLPQLEKGMTIDGERPPREDVEKAMEKLIRNLNKEGVMKSMARKYIRKVKAEKRQEKSEKSQAGYSK